MATLIAIMNLLPAILSAVQAVETALPMTGAGKAKLDLVLSTVTDVYAADQQIRKTISADQLIALVTGIVTKVVATFNSLGHFNKTR